MWPRCIGNRNQTSLPAGALAAGLVYREDSAIMAWELLNEPHTSDLYEKNHSSACRFERGGCMPGRLVHLWLADVSKFVKRLDPDHLVRKPHSSSYLSIEWDDALLFTEWRLVLH